MTALSLRTLLRRCRGAPRSQSCAPSSSCADCGPQVETFAAPKGPVRCKRCQRLGHTQRNCGYTPRCVARGEAHPSGGCSVPKEQLKCCDCGWKHTANYRGCAEWKRRRQLLQSGHRPKSPSQEQANSRGLGSSRSRRPHQNS